MIRRRLEERIEGGEGMGSLIWVVARMYLVLGAVGVPVWAAYLAWVAWGNGGEHAGWVMLVVAGVWLGAGAGAAYLVEEWWP